VERVLQRGLALLVGREVRVAAAAVALVAFFASREAAGWLFAILLQENIGGKEVSLAWNPGGGRRVEVSMAGKVSWGR
jgi:hypothetical protein